MNFRKTKQASVMKWRHSRYSADTLGLTLGLALTLAVIFPGSAQAASAPAQGPLLNAVSGAKPNLMFVLDNSGSMALEYQEGYNVNNACTNASGNNCTTKVCPAGYYTDTLVPGTTDKYIPYRAAGGQYCTSRSNGGSYYITPSNYVVNTYGWYQMRSSDINTQYYNPRITYLPRIKPDGSAEANNYTFVDNQASKMFGYQSGNYGLYQSFYVPDHKESTNNSVPAGRKFTYVNCNNNACSSRSSVEITFTSTAPVPLPLNHQRTDCGGPGASTCPATAERKNILNWYKWYRTRIAALSTAMGQAIHPYEDKFRIGYVQYSDAARNSGGYSYRTTINRGVRYFRDEPGNNWKTQLYTWLYGVDALGGTPTHQIYSLAAKYYARTSDRSQGNPWKNDPTSTANETDGTDLACRRSYTILFSDGAWNDASSSELPAAQYTNLIGTNFSGNPNGKPATMQYRPAGASGHNDADEAKRIAARSMYVPYSNGGKSKNGLADLAANYFWNSDFSSRLPNNVPPVPGQNNPTFWQNMTTFTIGWGLTPTGERSDISGGRLTWAQIEDYRNKWLAGDLTYTQPEWSDGRTIDLATAGEHMRINDFIHAGFAGGGKAYSVYSGDDVRRAIDDALSSMVGSGNDAGVAVSGDSGNLNSLGGQISFTTEYQTSDNTGDIKGFALDTDGDFLNVDATGKPVPVWSANLRMPTVQKRKIYALSNYDPGVSSGTRLELSYNTSLSSLPGDLRSELDSDGLQKSDSTFIRYLLGQNGLQNRNGAPYRNRATGIAASVNSPPVYVGGRQDMGYSSYGDVAGREDYAGYVEGKKALPAAIYAATNDGKVHVINAAKSDTEVNSGGSPVRMGEQLASFMPKGAMGKQTTLADPNYQFEYVLDGPLAEEDIYSGTSWKQVVLGSGGRAGKFLFALNSPLNARDRTPTKNDFLWEVDDKTPGYGDLGNVTNTPTAGQLDDGTWVMLNTSGHYAGAGRSVGLYITEALTGRLVKFIPLPPAYNNDVSTMKNRGLGGVVAVRDINRKIIAAYAGDASGNLWRFDLRSQKLSVSYNRPLFTTPGGRNQPIYAAPAWQVHPGDGNTCSHSENTLCGAIVVVGTGILLDEDDLSTPATQQAIFGIWDRTPIGEDDVAGLGQVSADDLVEQTIDVSSRKEGEGSASGRKFYQISSNEVDWNTKKGWMIKLGVITYPGAMPNGERVVGDVANLGGSVWLTSFIPEDKGLSLESCTATSNVPNNMYLVDALTGKNKRSFDYNSDGIADLYSVVSIADGGFTRGNVTSRNLIGKTNEGHVELNPPKECSDETGYMTGAGGTVKGFDACERKGWRRSWSEVVKTPF